MTAAMVLESIDDVRSLVGANPAIVSLPAGTMCGDAMAEAMRSTATNAMAGGFAKLTAEGRGAAFEYFKVAAEEFAVSTLILAVDRQSRAALAASRRKPWWRRWWSGLPRERGTPIACVLTEEQVASMKNDAQEVLSADLNRLEDLSRMQAFEEYKLGAEYFARATFALASEREILVNVNRPPA